MLGERVFYHARFALDGLAVLGLFCFVRDMWVMLAVALFFIL